jgi:hypothetical protein
MMATWFQVDVNSSAPRRIPSLPQSIYLGVCLTNTLVPALTDDGIIFDYNATNTRIWGGGK